MNSQSSRLIRWLSRLWLTTLASFLLLPSLAPAQTTRVPFEQGDHAFRFVLNLFEFQPLTDVSQLDENADHSILIVFGDTQILDSIPGRLKNFLDKGGAVFVATDRAGSRQEWQDLFRIDFAKDYVHTSEHAYRGIEECPFAVPIENQDPPIFKDLNKVATNRPVYFINRSKQLRTLAGFSEDCWVPVMLGRRTGRAQLTDLQNVPSFRASFAAGGELGKGRVLVLSDHSVFINAMMIPTDNDNFDFAYQCLDWLSEGRKRTRALFLNEGEAVSNFDVPVIDVPVPPMEVINQLLVKMEEKNLFNRMILSDDPNERDNRFREILRVLIVVLTTALTGFGCYRFLLARHVVETKEPLFAAKAAQQTPDVALATQRHLAMIKSDNFWEAAHHLARDWFLANVPDSLSNVSNPGVARPESLKGVALMQGLHAFRKASGRVPRRVIMERFSVDAGMWRRRSWEKKLQTVWQVAAGPSRRLSAAEFARFVTQLDEIKAALAKGTLRLKPSVD